MKLFKAVATSSFVIFFLASTIVNSQVPSWLWARGMGSGNMDLASSVAVDDSGNVYTTGYFTDTVDFDPGPGVYDLISSGNEDIFILKLNTWGNLVWAKSIGGSGFDWGYSIAINSSGDIFMTGFFSDTADFDPDSSVFNLSAAGSANDCFVARFNNNGDLDWAKSMGGIQSDAGSSIALDNSDNVYFTGSYNGTADFNPDPSDTFNLTAIGNLEIFVAKLDTSGNFVWAKSFGGIEDDQGYSIAVDENGYVYSTGYFEKTVDFDPGAGIFNLTSNGNLPDAYILKLDNDGNFIWARSLSGPASNDAYSIAVDRAGFVYTTGSFLGTVDFDPDSLATFDLTTTGAFDIYISKLDSSGNFVWAKMMGGTDDDQAFAIALDDSSNIFTTGIFRTTADFDPDASGVFNLSASGGFDLFVSKLDSAGNFSWAKGAGGNSRDQGSAIVTDETGNVFIAGHYYSTTLAIDTTTLVNYDSLGINSDILIASMGKLNTTGIQLLKEVKTLSLYPNPASDYIVLSIDKNLKDATIRMLDASGRIVLINKNVTGNDFKINIEKFPKGNYFISIENYGEFYTGRFSTI